MRAQSERLCLEYRDSQQRARELLARAGAADLRRRPQGGGWCAAECVEHLNLTAEDYMSRIREALAHGEVRPPRGEESMSWLGRFYARRIEPPPRRFYATSPSLMPPAEGARSDVLFARFDALRHGLIRLVEETDGVDRTRLRIALAESDWLRITLFDAFCLLAAHDRRHLWQAEQATRV